MLEWIAAQGGLVGLGVLLAKYSLILFSVLSVAVMVERALILRRLERVEAVEFPAFRESLARRQLGALHMHLLSSASPCAAITRAGLAHQSDGETRMREVMALETSAQVAGLQANLPVLATAATTAPYVGLFGTVLGILAAFREIAESGQTGASVVAGGISEALTATALGLGVAIPAVMAYNYFTGRVNRMALEIEAHALEIAMRLAAENALEAAETRGVPAAVATPEPRADAASRAEAAMREAATRADAIARETATREAALQEFAARGATTRADATTREAATREAAMREASSAREVAIREAAATREEAAIQEAIELLRTEARHAH